MSSWIDIIDYNLMFRGFVHNIIYLMLYRIKPCVILKKKENIVSLFVWLLWNIFKLIIEKDNFTLDMNIFTINCKVPLCVCNNIYTHIYNGVFYQHTFFMYILIVFNKS